MPRTRPASTSTGSGSPPLRRACVQEELHFLPRGNNAGGGSRPQCITQGFRSCRLREKWLQFQLAWSCHHVIVVYFPQHAY